MFRSAIIMCVWCVVCVCVRVCIPGQEAHIQQPVRLVQDQHVQRLDQEGKVQTICLPAEHVLQAAGRGDHYIGPGHRE